MDPCGANRSRPIRPVIPLLLFLLCILPVPGDSAPFQDDAPQSPPRFRADVDLVVVSVAVTDSENRHVSGLQKEDFRIFEDKVEQTIIRFDSERAPLSIGVVLDASGSMSLDLAAAKNSIITFLHHQAIPRDEYFLMTFSDKVTLAQDYTSATEEVDSEVKVVQAKGKTALLDAIYLGVEKLADASNAERVLLVATDGEDNNSRYSRRELEEILKESGVRVYFFGDGRRGGPIAPSPFAATYVGYTSRATLKRIADLTGGRAYFPKNVKALDYYCELVHTELRNLYRLGYKPTNPALDGTWRRLRVEVVTPEGYGNLHVRAKKGYVAPGR